MLCIATIVWPGASSAAPAVALYYGQSTPIKEFRAFDMVVVEPDHNQALQQLPGTDQYAYVSVAEVQASRPYYADIPAQWKLARNGAWKSDVIDQTPPEWADFFARRVIAPLWDRGYRGFFLDTLVSYRLAINFDEKAQQQGLVRVIETLHQRFPGIKLVLNRGFEIVPQVRDKIQMVAAESLYQAWNANSQRYEEVSETDRNWLLGQPQVGHPLQVLTSSAVGFRTTISSIVGIRYSCLCRFLTFFLDHPFVGEGGLPFGALS